MAVFVTPLAAARAWGIAWNVLHPDSAPKVHEASFDHRYSIRLRRDSRGDAGVDDVLQRIEVF